MTEVSFLHEPFNKHVKKPMFTVLCERFYKRLSIRELFLSRPSTEVSLYQSVHYDLCSVTLSVRTL